MKLFKISLLIIPATTNMAIGFSVLIPLPHLIMKCFGPRLIGPTNAINFIGTLYT